MTLPCRRPRHFASKAPWLVLVLRIVVASLSIQMGGVARDAADVVWAFAIGADAPDVDDDCLFDHGTCHCPPGCPNCHCSHGVASLPQSAPVPVLLVFSPRPETVRLDAADRSPQRAYLSTIYRPPRSV